MSICLLCKAEAVAASLELGPQPVCNRFLRSPDAPEALFPFTLGQCKACGLAQLTQPVPAEELRPRYDWISYSEPEGHLDQMVESIVSLPGINSHSIIGGILFGRDSTLDRFNTRGFARTWRLDLRADLQITEPNAGVETLQQRLTPETAESLALRRGPSDVLIARYVLEHAHDPIKFLSALKRLVRPGGYLVVEVPDCQDAFEHFDFSILWEEHATYFMPETFRACLRLGGLSVIQCNRNPLVAITTPQGGGPDAALPSIKALAIESNRMQTFAEALPRAREKVGAFLSQFRRNQGKIAVFGAGHLACMYINVLGLKKLIEFVVDDYPQKRGLFLPGSGLPIRGSDALLEAGVKLCLSTLGAESEQKVRRTMAPFFEQGGCFASIFPGRENSLPVGSF